MVWATRAAWVAVAVFGGSAVGEALDAHRRAVQLTGTAGAWTGWAVGALALTVPAVVTLTLVRTVVPAAMLVAIFALIDRGDPASAITLLAPALAAAALCGSAELGRAFLQASAYGAEARFGLRPPIGYLLASAVAWAVTASAVVLAPLLLAGRVWAAGVPCAAVAALGLVLFPRRWHQLSRRWLVLVPAGVVDHDPVVLAETLMLPRRSIAAVALVDDRPAASGTADLTGPTSGVAIGIGLVAATTVRLAVPPGRPATAVDADAVIVAPTRPGAVLAALVAVGHPGGTERDRVADVP